MNCSCKLREILHWRGVAVRLLWWFQCFIFQNVLEFHTELISESIRIVWKKKRYNSPDFRCELLLLIGLSSSKWSVELFHKCNCTNCRHAGITLVTLHLHTCLHWSNSFAGVSASAHHILLSITTWIMACH